MVSLICSDNGFILFVPDIVAKGGIHCQFKVGDKVRVDLEADILKCMQEGHGGWNPRMAEVSQK